MLELHKRIGKKIATLRKENSMTQEQLAEKLSITVKHCSSVERGLSSLSLEKLIYVADLFDVSLDYLNTVHCNSIFIYEKIEYHNYF